MSEANDSQGEGGNAGETPSPKKQTIVSAIHAFAKQQHSQNKKTAQGSGDALKWTKRSFWIAFGYSIITLIIAGAGIWSSFEASRGVDAATRAADIAADTEKRSLRAYMVLDQSNIIRFEPGQTIVFHGVIKNTRLTPAYDIDAYTAIMFDKYPLPHDFPDVPEIITDSSSVIGHDGVIHLRVPTKPLASQPIIDAINAGTMAVYVWGRATYRDAFGVHRCTNFRLFYTKCQQADNRPALL